MLKIVLLLITLLLLVGGGFGGYMLYQQYMPEAAAPPPEEVKPEEKGPPVFVRMKPLVVSVIGNGRVDQFITLELQLEIANQRSATTVEKQMPKLTDAFIRALYGAIDRGMVMNGELVKLDAVKAKLLQTSRKLFGEDKVLDVLVQNLHQRRM